MNKRGLIFVSLSLVFLLSLSFVSAGFFSDFWNKFTGKAISSQTQKTFTHPLYDGLPLCMTHETAQAFCMSKGYNHGKEGTAYSGGSCAKYDSGWKLYQQGTIMNVICYNNTEPYWTQWYDRDDPSGKGDYETLSSLGDVCPGEKITDVQCETTDGKNLSEVHRQRVICNPNVGLYCENKYGKCSDYKVRFYCSPATVVCSDNDEKDNLSVKGVCTDSTGKYPDRCSSSGTLVQYSCNKDKCVANLGNCPSGQVCSNGVCVSPSSNTCAEQSGNICQDYEVCNGEILSANDTYRCCQGSCELPNSFDWRNRHGENWNTPVKDQGRAGTCRSFAPVGAFESQINLYFNQHLDLDLSEQMIEDCMFRDFLADTTLCTSSEGYDLVYCKTQKWGLPDESCDPYEERESQFPTINTCTNEYICDDWDTRGWKNNHYNWYDIHPNDTTSDDIPGRISAEYPNDIKKYLILNGPMSSGLVSWNHNMVLEGYKTDSDGETIWIFKNSWGSNGWDGYIKTKAKIFNYGPELNDPIQPQGPFLPPSDTEFWPDNFSNTINCIDNDNDGFCNWGISKDIPSTCPSFCKSEKDWDDSDPNIHALGTQSNRQKIFVVGASKQEGFVPVEITSKDRDTLLCNGCRMNDTCYPYGYRLSGKFCGVEKAFKPQFEKGESCENNFECSTNLCTNGTCITKGVLEKFRGWFSRLFRLICIIPR